MAIYLIIYGVCCFLSLFAKGKSTGLLIFFSLFFLVFIGLRVEIGVDWFTYLRLKEEVQIFDNVFLSFVITEPGYAILNYYSSSSEEGIYLVNFVCALIFTLGLFIFCKDQKYPLLSFSIAIPYLIFVVAMGYTRQSAALGFIFLGYKAFSENKLKSFIAYLLLAFLFHMSSIVVIFLVFFILSKKNLVAVSIAGSVAIAALFIVFKEMIFFKLGFYGSDDEITSQGGIFRHLLNVIPSILFFIYRAYFRSISGKYYKLLMALSTGSVCLLAASFFMSTFADRIAVYFLIVQCLVYPLFIKKFVKLDQPMVICCVLGFYFLFLYVWFSTSSFAQLSWIPYKNYLFN